MAPGVGGLVAGSDLIDCPCALAHAVAAGVVEGFDDVQRAHAHPYSFVAWLFLHQDVDVVVYLGDRFIHDYDRVAAYVSLLLPAP